ncbi:hypothetical protein APR50_10680 [Variovorax paradoxus]|jgi:hypothetical protein|uniref:hypothetical protein n=1 Tax=Variovorax paradoxus TaxID=34073 RepID=UPI0006E4BA71|nr:hypothetical protein APR52_20915 [Variovorax paradoxus]KPV08927.1 hypothetical protein APR50_10680 [Variovorax paradoxus]KPV11424.1 hypothetical protein APR49_09555 [Variovorax paradoxus]KPV23313.1 hypothetical protein APR51_08115 [Variovorax paradoxus]KPV31119.1 hypothetical protein APR48_17480 [Variovorax paradoxus]
MTTDFTETTYRVVRTDGYGVHKHSNDNGDVWLEGVVRTPHGFLRVYSEERRTSISLIHDGYEVTRVWERGFQHRALVTLARRFAEEMQP